MSAVVENARAAAQERLLEGLSVSSSWTGRKALCPPAAAASLLPLADKNATALYMSGLLAGRLVSGVWPTTSTPQLETIASNHVYCVANVPFLSNSFSTLLISPQDECESPHPALIKCSAIRTRTAQELAELRGKAYPNILTANKTAVSADTKTTLTNGTSKVETKPNVKPVKEENIPVKTISSTAKSKSNIIAGLFARQISKPKLQNSPPPVETKPEVKTVPEKVLNDKVKSNNKKKSKTGNKKRKRIEVAESDDSDDSAADNIFEPEPEEPLPIVNFDEEDEIPPTPEAPKRKHSPDRHSQKRKRDKTFLGEDGYFHTIKNVVCSDDENVDNQKENSESINKCDEIPNTPESERKPNSKVEDKPVEKAKTKNKSKSKLDTKKVSPPNQGKQSKIMSFFKKQ